jgi:hypothetical protein
MKNAKRFFVLLFAGMACIVMFGLLLLYVNYISGRAIPTFPRITIDTTIPEGTGVVNQSVIVFGEASDPDGIESAELWVNGARVASQTNPDQNLDPFEISQSWIPDGPGNYLFLLRGIDRKGFAGESSPVLIQIGERTFQPDPAMQGQYIVQEGDTIDDIASQLGTTPEEIRVINPELGEPLPFESLSVPSGPETTSGGDTPSPTDESDEPPHVSAPSALSPEEGTPAVPASTPWWGSLPLPDSFSCILTPVLCTVPIAGDTPPLPASDVHASLMDACQVSVSWTDHSTNEAGFRVYRLITRPRFHFELIALLDPSPNSGGRLSYIDTSAPTGEFYYAVATINLRGEEVWSAPSEKITTICSTSTAGVRTLDVEALQMTISDPSIERLYCYLSLAGSPFERIPEGASEFITLEGGAWNIAEYASGDNKRTIMMDGSIPLEIIAECLGWQGGMLIDLGRFTRSHPPEEWDGRPLTAGPDDGAFSVTYRIQPTTSDETSAGYGGGGEVPTLPVPFNLRTTDTWTSCRPFTVGSGSVCSTRDEPGIAWDYEVDPANPRPPLYFKVSKVVAIGSSRRFYFTTTLDGIHMSAPLDTANCETRTNYHVSAVVGIDPVSGVEIESSYSETLGIEPTCRILEIILYAVGVNHVEDGDLVHPFYEAYGWLKFNNTLIRWNNHCDSGLCGGGTSSAYTVINRREYGANLFLSTPGGRSFSQSNNVIHVPIRDGEALNWQFQIMDHDDASADDLICSLRRSQELLPARSRAEWLSVDQYVEYYDSGVSGCAFAIHVRGIPGTP